MDKYTMVYSHNEYNTAIKMNKPLLYVMKWVTHTKIRFTVEFRLYEVQEKIKLT